MAKFRSGPSFTAHVPCHPWGSDPSLSNKLQGQPAPTRQTFTFSWVNRGNGGGLVSLMQGAPAPATGAITCTQANVVPGSHVIRVGIFELRPGVDFAVGGSDNVLADNLAAAIDALPGFSAPNPAANVVAISTTSGHGDDNRLEVVEWGAASGFTLGALNQTNVMNRGTPAPGAPLVV